MAKIDSVQKKLDAIDTLFSENHTEMFEYICEDGARRPGIHISRDGHRDIDDADIFTVIIRRKILDKWRNDEPTNL